MYAQKLSANVDFTDKEETPSDFMVLAELWVLGDKLLIPRLQNAAIQELERRRAIVKYSPTRCCNYVWSNTKEGAPLRQYFLRLCAWKLEPTWFRNHSKQFSKQMLIDLVEMIQTSVSKEHKEEQWKLDIDYLVPEEGW